ncbi:expressed unknown protein [Ectocarpus siliculosus]|uniref:Uncharacterized protein n=1 Tax=Ectocarpus siliculosus TaxID=2880 RepID=D7G3A9_ECTSI|nr:expressed unknown protein [Ectocarpus siliculosus]|eukprot:CBJ33503.1 expressed unknown protein [Ectocarpus siliculosus]
MGGGPRPQDPRGASGGGVIPQGRGQQEAPRGETGHGERRNCAVASSRANFNESSPTAIMSLGAGMDTHEGATTRGFGDTKGGRTLMFCMP